MFIEVSTEEHIAAVVSLAEEIWTEHYIPIIGKEQVAYMLEKFQSKEAVSDQIRSGCRYFLIEENTRFIGYAAVQPKGDELFLSKIYFKSSVRRKGYGAKTVQFLETLARAGRFKKITLTVNKNNVGSIKAYAKMNFKNVGSVIQDIGSGFVMDDYKMEKTV
jgi:ribosomal protein S18 acetylase RimI-like enzyme